MLVQKNYSAEEFFSGRSLEIARAIDAGNMDLVRKLAPGVDLAATGQKGMTLMWFAILRRNYPAVETLVALGVDPDKQVAKGIGSALYLTMIPSKDPNDQTGIRLFRAMLDGGLSPNYKTKDDDILLQRVIGTGGSLAAVQLLVERGADINARDGIGGTALSDATLTKPDIALYLVNHGANINSFDVTGVSVTWSVYDELEDRGQEDPLRPKYEQLRDLMIQKGAKWPPDPPEVVRDRMRAQGLEPAVPPGQAR